MSHRPHAAHAEHSNKNSARSNGQEESPSHLLVEEDDPARILLEELDDVVFKAIQGDSGAISQAHELWPKVVRDLGWELVEESRAQYLRYATHLAEQWNLEACRDPARAVAAMEIIELLARDA